MAIRNFDNVFHLRFCGPSTRELLGQNNYLTKILKDQHHAELKKRVEDLKKLHVKNDKELLDAFKKVAQTPQQEWIVLHELSMQAPLNADAFQKYFELTKQILPQFWKQMYGDKTPAQIRKECESK